MLIGFEGTGWTGENDLRNYKGPKGGRSFVHMVICRSKSRLSKYIPGPNVGGTNCSKILDKALDYYFDNKDKIKNDKLSLVGYSRGAYLAMCFAKVLFTFNEEVFYMGLFDSVSRDVTINDSKRRAYGIPMNVRHCFHAYRSPTIGSRKWTMDYFGQKWESGEELKTKIELPGSHAAIGGFPNEAGPGDGPSHLQGDPNYINKFHPQKEATAWWEAGNYISKYAVHFDILHTSLVNGKPDGYLEDKSAWYKAQPPNIKPSDYWNGEYGKPKM